jgi:hypothetical protein
MDMLERGSEMDVRFRPTSSRGRWLAQRALLAVALAVSGCRSAPVSSSSSSSPDLGAATGDGDDARGPTVLSAATVDGGAPHAALPPLAAEWMERIDLANGGVVYVAPPVGSTEPRPIVVAVHGAMDDPGLICSAWRLITDVYPFVVCPGGTPVRRSTYVWPSSDAIEKTVDVAVAAVRAKYGARVHDGPAIYAAFSQGANMAGPVLGRRAAPGRATFARAVLSEGGYRAFETRAAARAFGAAGGERVLFTCSQPGCSGWFEGSRAALASDGTNVRVAYAGPYGHSMPPPVRESINAALPWVVDGLPGWETYASAPKLSGH